MKIKILLIFSLVCLTLLIHPSSLGAQNLGENKEVILRGIDLMYNTNFEEADNIFDQEIARNPGNPLAYYFKAEIELWKYLFDNNQDALRRFYQEADKTVQVAENALKSNPKNSLYKSIIGGAYGFRAMVNLKAENFVKASWDSKICYDNITDALKINPKETEAYVPMGIFDVVLGSIPQSVKTLANLGGLTGDKNRGVKELEVAAQKATYFKNDAKFILGLLAVYIEQDYTKGISHLKELLAKYPNNIPILYALGNIEVQLKKNTNAVYYFQKVYSLSDKSYKVFTAISSYRLGEAYFRLNDFSNAKKYMQIFVKTTTEKPFVASAFFRMGVAYEMLGDRTNAEKAYKKTLEYAKIIAEDRYAVRKAKEYLKQPLSEVTKSLIKGCNAVESNDLQSGEKLLTFVINTQSGASIEQKAEAYYQLGEGERSRNNLQISQNHFQRVLELNPQEEKWLVPFSYFRMAQNYYNLGNKELSRNYVDKARIFTGFDFHEWLKFLIERDVQKAL